MIERCGKNIDTAGIERGKARFSADKVQRCALARAGFSKGERAVVKVKGGKGAAAIGSFLLLAPVQTAGNHEMKDQPEIVVKAEGNALAHAAQRSHVVALNRIDRRIGGAKKRRAADFKIFQHVADDALLQRFHVNDNVWKFRHPCRFAPNRLQRLGAG